MGERQKTMACQRCFALTIETMFVFGILVLGTFAPSVFGQGYPIRAINLVLPNNLWDGTDVGGRLMLDALAKALKVPVVALNKPGAAGAVGTSFVAKAKSDGYTILLSQSAPIIYNKVAHPQEVPYDPFKDLTPWRCPP
jgi:tripartite-type tricarboxylate transporter receptor subunit TctC